jgi:hypothetical protein
MGRRCIAIGYFNKDESWYLAEATRLLQTATKLVKAKNKAAAKKAPAKKAAKKKVHE